MLGLLGVMAMLYAIRSTRALRARCTSFEESLAAVRRELELVTSLSTKNERRVRRIEHECSGVADRVERVELRGQPQCFEQAIDFARRGGDPAALATRYGLSLNEAELVARLHGHKKIA